jgi:hypothetical protein
MPDVDIPGFESALDELRPRLAQPLQWLVPDDQRNFDGITVAQVFASGLLMSFLAGFNFELHKQAKKAGVDVAKWLSGNLRHLVTNESTEPVPEAISKAAREASGHEAESAAAADALLKAEAAIAATLAEHLPKKDADAIAQRVTKATKAHILKKKR